MICIFLLIHDAGQFFRYLLSICIPSQEIFHVCCCLTLNQIVFFLQEFFLIPYIFWVFILIFCLYSPCLFSYVCFDVIHPDFYCHKSCFQVFWKSLLYEKFKSEFHCACLLPVCLQQLGLREAAAGSSVQLSYVGDRNPVTWAITDASQGLH